MRMWKRAILMGALGLAAGGAVGCAEERAPINRVQPNALAKSFFVGALLNDRSDDPEFWAQGTLVDVGYGAAQDGFFTSTYAQPLSRIKWQVTEDFLFGRITHERIDDSDGKGAGVATERRRHRVRLPDHQPLRHSPGLQLDDRGRVQRGRGELLGSRLERARVLPRRLVAEPRHRLVRLRHALAARRLRQHQLRVARLLHQRPEQTRRAVLRSDDRLLRRHEQGLREAQADRPVELRLGHRQLPRLLPRQRLHGRHVPRG
jgi:hypothetical protein